MGMDDPGRYITRPTVIILFLICFLIYLFVIPSGNNSTEIEPSLDPFSKRSKHQPEKVTKKEVANNNDHAHELTHGFKRYKLYEKKRFNFKKAEAFCRKMEGRLAKTERLDEMTRLQTLLQKAKLVSDELWIGVERKQWKNHAWKDKPHPPGMNPAALGEMNAMMMGGGKQEMCPALSLSTRAMVPAMCMRDLPFVCEFDRVDKSKDEPKKENVVKKEQGKSNRNKNNNGAKTKGKPMPPPKTSKTPKISKVKATPKPKQQKKANKNRKKDEM